MTRAREQTGQLDISSLSLTTDSGSVFRTLTALLLGLVIAGALTWFMHVLIEASHQELDQSVRANLLDFVRVEREESSQRKKVKPKRPQTQQAPPAPSPRQSNQQMADADLNVAIPSVDSNIDVDVSGIGVGTGDGEYLPIVKVAPVYPIKASMNNTEGDCLVEYTVTTTGATRDIRVIKDQCPQVFSRASVRAAKKFKYKPRVIDGQAIEVPNVKNKFKFRLATQGEQQ